VPNTASSIFSAYPFFLPLTIEMLEDRRLLAGNEPHVNTIPCKQHAMEVDKTFTIRVVNANDAPVAVADSYWVSVGTFQILDVLANDSDTDGAIDPTSIEIAQPPSHGTATPLPDGTVRYTPNAGYRDDHNSFGCSPQ
jgi:hypothetical protein